MSLERLYYNDPFSNIVISCDLHCTLNIGDLSHSLGQAIMSVPALGEAVALDEESRLTYTPVGHQRNLQNILPTSELEDTLVPLLMAHPFDLPNGESIKIAYRATDFGYTLYFCMHHIVGDANSLILLLRKVIAQIQNNPISVLHSANIAQEPTAQPDAQVQYLIQTINKLYPHKGFTSEEYLRMHRKVFTQATLDVRKIVLDKATLAKMKEFCKHSGVSITAYLVSEVFKQQKIDTVCLPVDTRSTPDLFGNFVGRIDITKKLVEKETTEEGRLQAIYQTIQTALKDKLQQDQSEQILSQIHPQFYDDVIFDAYGDRINPSARRMAKLIRYKDPRPTTFLSNLKQVHIDPHISNLCFYPPHPMERSATIGVVTQNDQMVITVQTFRKESRNE